MKFSMRPRAPLVWNETGSLSEVGIACGCTPREADRFLSTCPGYPGLIPIKPRLVRLTAPQITTPFAPPVTLPPMAFLDPERRLPWESRK